MASQREINELQKKVYKMYLFHERMIDLVAAIFIFIIIFGMGFTFGYYFR